MSIMLISHDLSTISEICEKVGIMYGGKMIEFGTSHEIFEKPKHPYTQALIQSIPRLHGNEKPKYIPGSPPNLLDPKSGCRFIDRCPHVMEKCKKDPPKIQNGLWLCAVLALRVVSYQWETRVDNSQHFRADDLFVN